MRRALLPTNESRRLLALRQYDVLNESPDATLDDLVALVARVCQMPVAVISFIDADHQWIKAGVNFPASRLPRADSLCGETIMQPEVLLIPDMTTDERYAGLPLVASPPRLAAYAGAPIVTPEGCAIGVVAVLDYSRRDVAAVGIEVLQVVARQVMDHLELRRNLAELAAAAIEREQMADELRDNEERYRRLFTTAQRQSQEQALLERVRTAVARVTDLAALFHTIVEAVAETFGYTQVSLYLLQGNVLLLQHQVGYSRVINEVPIETGVSGRVIRSGQPILIKDVRTDPDFLEAIEGIVSEVCVPLFDADQVAGVLNVESTNGVTLTEADLTLLIALADHASVALSRTRLYAEARRQARELALLDKVRSALARQLELPELYRTVVQAIVETFGYSHVSFYILTGDRLVLQHQVGYENPFMEIGLNQGVIGYVATTGEPVLIRDVLTDPRYRAAHSNIACEIAVPLKDRERMAGVLNIESGPDLVLTEADLALMLALSDQIGLAIGRARLYEEARRRSRLLSGLHETALDLLNRLELGDLLSAIVSRAAQLVDTNDGYIYLLEPAESEMEIKVAIGHSARFLGDRLRPGEGLAGRVWDSGQPLAVESYADWPHRLPRFQPEHTFAAAAVPLRSRAQIIGILGTSYDRPGRTFGADEVEVLGRFAQLATLALDNARLYTTAQHELAERNRTEQALAATNMELEQALLNAKELAIASQAANRTKSEFLANMSHELRTPLSAVMGYSELLQGTALNGEQKDYLEQIRVSSEALLGIIGDVLDFSKIEAGHMQMEWTEFNLVDTARQALYTMMPQAAARKLHLTTAVEPDVPRFVVGDSARLRQVLVNLLSNGVKFTQQGQVILRIANQRVSPDQFVLQFSVQDTGSGIPADKLRLIFEPFTQVDGSMTRRYGGTGLGLAIARQLVDMLDGRIWVESEVGRGSTFHFTAAFGRPVEPVRESPSPGLPARGGLPEASAQHLNILLAEDNVVNQRVIARMLEKLGWKVKVVDDGQAAVAASAEEDYDLILMDVQMPEMDGLNATTAIRSRERQIGGHLPIVALTAYAMQGDRERCLMAGMDDYLSKPVRVDDLQQVIERLAGLNATREPDDRIDF